MLICDCHGCLSYYYKLLYFPSATSIHDGLQNSMVQIFRQPCHYHIENLGGFEFLSIHELHINRKFNNITVICNRCNRIFVLNSNLVVSMSIDLTYQNLNYLNNSKVQIWCQHCHYINKNLGIVYILYTR